MVAKGQGPAPVNYDSYAEVVLILGVKMMESGIASRRVVDVLLIDINCPIDGIFIVFSKALKRSSGSCKNSNTLTRFRDIGISPSECSYVHVQEDHLPLYRYRER